MEGFLMALQQIPTQTINGVPIVPIINAAPQANTTGGITSATSSIAATDLTGIGSATVQISGAHTGINMIFEASSDAGTTWFPIQGMNQSTGVTTTAGATGVITSNATVVWTVSPLLGISQFRVRATAWGTGTGAIVIHPSTQFVPITVQLAAGGAQIGSLSSVGSITPGTGASNLGKLEDAAHASGDAGIFILGVRNDAATTNTSATGDYAALRTDQFGQNVSVPGASGTETVTRVTAAAASTSLLTANASRKGASFYNESTATAYLKRGATASITSYTIQIGPGGYYELPQPIHQGAIDCIWSAANGAMQITEVI